MPGVTLFQMDARFVPFEEEFDVIGAFDALEHIKEDEDVLREIFRATKEGGGIILTVPQHPFLWSQMDEISHHYRRYTRRGLIDKVQRAGFEVVYTGLHQTPEQIVSAAIQEDVDLIGMSSLAGAHLYLFQKVIDLLKAQGADDIMVIGGGIIPEEDIGKLKALGVREIFSPGTPLETIVDWVHQNMRHS